MFEGLRKKLSNAVKGFVKTEVEKAEELPAQTIPEAKQNQTAAEPVPGIEQEKAVVHAAQDAENHKVIHKQETAVEQRHVEGSPKAEKREEKLIKLSLTTKIKGAVLGSVTLNDSDIERFVEAMKVSMLESDVSYDTTERFLEDLNSKLKGRKVNSRDIEKEIVGFVRESLFDVLKSAKEGVKIVDFAKQQIASGNTPVKILFLGPNGTGKTTTIAKLTHSFKNNGISVVMSASDTFRAAAIEQMAIHAQRLGVPVIKSTYGADPASVAFDAIAYGKAHGINVVMIDSAGRQETNKNLISEVQKMVKVAKPDLTVYVGESISGNAIAEQIKEFSKYIRIDGIILTKLDADAKGGNALSIAQVTGIPVLFFGTGESYDALVPYSPEFVVNAVMPNN
ncbi:MAG: signal recognition particle-docking protein FtsY [Candidatus Micrarchaeota archaeon]|nr:signal recognition particle-docking protein FtsY [Candidatus Micrarchaeota archaeon]